MTDTGSKLDEIMSRPFLYRKVSTERTDECTHWNVYEQLWEESDAQFRERIKAFEAKK